MALRLSMGILLTCLTVGCSGGPPRVPGGDGPSLLARVRQKYATVDHYADTGHSTSRHEAGESTVRFATTMDRGTSLRFRFGSRETLEDSLTHSKAGTALTLLGETTQVESLLVGARQFAGISLLSSLVVPSLLYGIDFCDCFDNATATIIGDPQIVPTTVRVQARPERHFDLLIDPRSLVIREARFTRNEILEGRVPYTVIVYEQVSVP
jgi:hypothetical protein